MVDQRVRHVVISAHRHALHAPRTQIVAPDKIEHDGHARMRERAARMRLDRYARKRERPRIAELAIDHFDAVSAARRAEEAALAFEAVRRRREAERRQLRSDDAALGCAPGVKRFRHRAEIFAQSSGLRRAETQCAPRRVTIKIQQLRRGGGRANRAACRGAVKSLLVVTRQDRLRDLAFHLDADLIRRQKIAAAAPIALRERQHGRQRRRRGVRQESVHAILRGRELRVVVIVGVDRNAVRKRCEASRQA